MYIKSGGHSPIGVRPASVIFKAFAFFTVLPLLVLLLTSAVPAQKTSGQINGSVLDQQGAAVPAASVKVTQVDTGLKRTVMTSDDGNFSVTDLPIGTYRVAVSKTGFKETVAQNVTVNVSTVTRQDFSLEIGAIGEVVTIQSSDIQVETETGAIGEVVTGQQVRELAAEWTQLCAIDAACSRACRRKTISTAKTKASFRASIFRSTATRPRATCF